MSVLPRPAQGVLRLGDEIEVRPGIVTKDAQGEVTCIPIYSRIVSLYAEHNDLKVGRGIPPSLVRRSNL